MPKENPVGSKNLKLDLLRTQKKVVDLELTLTEIKEKLKGIDVSEFSKLKEQVSDLEDLIMVENAGVIELKKMMEEFSKKLEKPTLPPEVKQKLEKLEKDIAALSAAPSTLEIDELHKQIKNLGTEMEKVKTRFEELTKKINEKIKAIELQKSVVKPAIDFDFISSKLESLKNDVMSLSKSRIKTELKLEEIESELQRLNKKLAESPAETVIEGIKSNKKGLIAMNIRVDSLERVMREIINNLRNMENSIKKFESVERITELRKDVEEKIERFKFIEMEMRRLSSKVEKIYENIDERIEKIRILENRLANLFQMIRKLEKEIDKNRLQVLERVKKSDIEKIQFVKLEELEKMKSLFNQQIHNLEKKLNELKIHGDRKTKELLAIIREELTKGSISEQIQELINRSIFLETRINAIERMFQEKTKPYPIIIE